MKWPKKKQKKKKKKKHENNNKQKKKKKQQLWFEHATPPKCIWFAFLSQTRYRYRHRASNWMNAILEERIGQKSHSLGGTGTHP